LSTKDTLTILCNQYLTSELFHFKEIEQSKKQFVRKINDSVIYIDTRIDSQAFYDDYLVKNKCIKHIIFDLRGPTKWIKPFISSNFFLKKTLFANWFTPVPLCPGSFENKVQLEIGPEKYNQDYFKGNKYLLVNEFTQSQGEFQSMFLQSAPNTLTIGSKTAGSDGNLSKLIIPGSITLNFSGAGIEYLDGYKCQYQGIKIDYEIKPSISDTQKQIDPVLDFTIGLIEQEKF
jgi:hypothetical protein